MVQHDKDIQEDFFKGVVVMCGVSLAAVAVGFIVAIWSHIP